MRIIPRSVSKKYGDIECQLSIIGLAHFIAYNFSISYLGIAALSGIERVKR